MKKKNVILLMLYDTALSAFKAIYSISFLKKLFNLVFFI